MYRNYKSRRVMQPLRRGYSTRLSKRLFNKATPARIRGMVKYTKRYGTTLDRLHYKGRYAGSTAPRRMARKQLYPKRRY